MNFAFHAFAIAAVLADAAHGWNTVENESRMQRHHPHMWMFGENGVDIYTPDGSEIVKTTPPENICKNVTSSDGSSRVRCDFSDVVSDGNKFVWASVARGVPKIDVFRIDTGDLVGSFQTCGNPGDMDIHPMREEMWVHCSEFSNASESHIDVFSTVSPTSPITTTIQLHNNTNMRAYGKLAMHPDLGDVAYSSVSGTAYLNKIDLAERTVIDQFLFEEDNPKFYGLYDMVYSPVNGHIYVRTEVCCTCGFEGADTLECGRYGSKNITIQGELTEGQCGKHCQGGPTDNIGIIEFDTNTDTVVGTHQFMGTGAVYAPFLSDDSEYIILAGLDGGASVEMLRAGESGVKSEVARTLSLDFNTTNVEESNVYRDFAYVHGDEMNLFVLASSNDYKVAIVDMDSAGYETTYVSLKDIPYEGRSYSRQVEWVEGTPYVWIGGRQDDEAYVIDVVEKTLVRTFTEVDPRQLLAVAPHHFNGMSDEQQHSHESGTTSYTMSSAEGGGGTDSGGSNDALSIAALALSIVAIVAVVANIFAKKSGAGDAPPTKSPMLLASDAKSVDPSLAVPPSVA